MKQLTLTSLLLLLSYCIFAQNAYYDALYLSTLSKGQLDNLKKGSGNFSLPKEDSLNIENVIKFLNFPLGGTDKFDIALLKAYVIKNHTNENSSTSMEGEQIEFSDFMGASSLLGLLPTAISGGFSLSADDQSNIIDGLGKYYAEEFKKAQLLTYMNAFESSIGKVGEFQIFFPETYKKLKMTDPSKFPELGNEYKDIFNADLRKIIDNLITHIEDHARSSNSPKYTKEITVPGAPNSYYIKPSTNKFNNKLRFLNGAQTSKIRDNPNYNLFRISADIGSKLTNNYHPVDLFNHLDQEYYDKAILAKTPLSRTSDEKVKMLLHGINLLQHNLLDTANSKDKQFANVWLNFEQLNQLNTSKKWELFAGLIYQQDPDYFKEVFYTAGTYKVEDFQKKVKKMLSVLIEIQNFRANLKEENLEDNFIDFMGLVVKTLDKFNSQKEDISKYLRLTGYTLNLYDNARKKDYSNTIYYVSLLLSEFIGSSVDPIFLEIMQKADEYGSFMAGVINTENSDEVKEVIKKYAAPPASFILKREYNHTISITGQPGYFAGLEQLEGKNAFSSGITLPLGIDYSLKLRPRSTENSASLGIFAQVIDIGAVLNFRLGDTTSTLPDKITFQQIFSPGGSLTLGLKNSPVTLALGYQYTSQLRDVSLESIDADYPNGHRFFFRMGWDIPLINVWKKKKRY